MEQSPASGPRAQINRGDLIVRAAFARLDLVALMIATGVVCALGLWGATAILLAKGPPPGVGPADHVVVGPHLALLANLLPGYAVTWGGSLIGLAYGFLIGLGLGAIVATVWNVVHYIYLMMVIARRYLMGEL